MADIPNLPGIPSISPVKDTTLYSILKALKESIEVLGSAITGSPLANGSIIDTGFNPAIATGAVAVNTTDYTPPPAPTGFTVAGAFANILLEWDTALYQNHAYTEVWRGTSSALSTAILLGFAPGSVYTDTVNNSDHYYYWIRFVSQSGIHGPYNASLGTSGTASTDPTYMLSVLSSQLSSSQLSTSLNSRINLIDAASTGLVTQVSTLSTTVGSVSSASTSATNAANSASAAVATLASTVAGPNGSTAQYTVKVDANGYVAGFGLSSTYNNATPYSEFQILANKFAIAPSATDPAALDGSPFYVLTTPTTVNGVSVSAGTYMKAAYIANASIGNAQIRALAVDTAKIADASISTVKIVDASITNAKVASIDATKITTGQLTADRIDSRSLTIKDAAGNVLFGSGTNLTTTYISGLGGFATLSSLTSANIGTYMSTGAITNAYIQDAAITSAKIGGSITSTAYTAGSVGWSINKDGTAEFNNGTFRGTLAVQSSTTGQRTVITNAVIKVYDASNVVRVQIGDLSA